MKSYTKLPIMLVTLLALFAATAAVNAQDLHDPGESEPYHPALVTYRVAIFYQVRGEHQRAIAEFTQTIDGLPTLGYAYAARGDSYVALGDYEQAVEDYSQAIEIYPDYVSALYRRGRAYAALGETDMAIADYTNAISQMPEYASPYWGLGDLYYEAGETAKAVDNYGLYLQFVTDEPSSAVTARVAALEAFAAAESM